MSTDIISLHSTIRINRRRMRERGLTFLVSEETAPANDLH
jgi:hypothetical protein